MLSLLASYDEEDEEGQEDPSGNLLKEELEKLDAAKEVHAKKAFIFNPELSEEHLMHVVARKCCSKRCNTYVIGPAGFRESWAHWRSKSEVLKNLELKELLCKLHVPGKTATSHQIGGEHYELRWQDKPICPRAFADLHTIGEGKLRAARGTHHILEHQPRPSASSHPPTNKARFQALLEEYLSVHSVQLACKQTFRVANCSSLRDLYEGVLKSQEAPSIIFYPVRT